MAVFWEEIRKRVREHTTSADVAAMIYQKIASTGVAGPAIIKPAFYLSQLSVLTMDFIDLVERLQEEEDRNWAALLRCVCFLRECARSMVIHISAVTESLERLITMTEEVLEGEDLAALEEEEADDEEPEESLQAGATEATPSERRTESTEEIEDLHNVEREEMFPDREKLEETLRVKFRAGGFSDKVVEMTASQIGAIYLECVQFSKELSRLSKAPEQDTSTLMSILIDLQYGLESQLRGLLVEDVNVTEVEPAFALGFFTWSSHFLAELMETIGGERPTVLAGATESH